MNSDASLARRSPFFVIGSPRSGTTLLRLMLTSHPELVVPPECGFMVWLHPTFGSWDGSHFSEPACVARFSAEVVASRKFETWGIAGSQIVDEIRRCKPQTFGEASACVYRVFCARSGKASATWGDKNNYYLSHIGILSSIFPHARFIHIVRDGRDVACSYREVMSIGSDSRYRPSLPIGIDEIASQWSGDVRQINEQLGRLDADAFIELRYEDLVSDASRELARLCDWLGVPFSAEMLRFHAANRATHLEPVATMDWKPRTLEPVSANTMGRYASLLTVAEISRFVAIAGHELRQYRYLSDHETRTT